LLGLAEFAGSKQVHPSELCLADTGGCGGKVFVALDGGVEAHVQNLTAAMMMTMMIAAMREPATAGV
jgi:hypothetical protein